MEIQAKLSFKHGRIMRVADSAGISIKELSTMCGWSYQNLLGFVSFKRLPQCEDHYSLLCTLRNIDPTITEDEVFPTHYDNVKEFLYPRISVNDIPVEKILSCNPDVFAIEDHTENRVTEKIDLANALLKMSDILSEIEQTVIYMFYGVKHKKPYTTKEIGEKLHLSSARIHHIKIFALRKLRRNAKMEKYKNYFY